MVDVGSRGKATITARNERGEFYVGRNHEYNDRTGDGLYLTLLNYKGTYAYQAFDVADIPALIEALQSVADDFEALKANEPTNGDKMDALPTGSIIRFNSETSTWTKRVSGEFVGLAFAHEPLVLSTFVRDDPYYTLHVVYNPEEVN